MRVLLTCWLALGDSRKRGKQLRKCQWSLLQ
uniref:Uncharacterized protein n=1 Tax=Arundo donax TaxID=35708 RepID=A0A0A9BB89_ARUDO